MRDIRFGGGAIFLGTLLFVATIAIEFAMDWSTPGARFGLEKRVEIFSAAWPLLSKVWTAQMAGALLMTIGGVSLLGSSLPKERFIPISVILATATVSGIIVTASFGQALGAYPVALANFEDSPNVFATLLGELSINYRGGAGLLLLSYIVFVVQEGFTKDGMLPRLAAYIIIALVIGALATVALGLLLAKTAGVVAFAAPAFIGWSLLKHPSTQSS